jgi:hypothetical protein
MLIALSAAPWAQAQSPRSKDASAGASESFTSGAHQIGEGAQRIGEGIKQGAIDAWEAVKAGASAAAAKFGGHSDSKPESKRPAGASTSSAH